MSPSDQNSLHEKIDLEMDLISRELSFLTLIRKKARIKEPDGIELRAAASSLHSVYNGYEKLFKLVALSRNLSFPQDHKWHKNLLDAVKPIILDNVLHTELQKLLGFRHFFRHSYSFSLNWINLEPLIISTCDFIQPSLKDSLQNYSNR